MHPVDTTPLYECLLLTFHVNCLRDVSLSREEPLFPVVRWGRFLPLRCNRAEIIIFILLQNKDTINFRLFLHAFPELAS